MRNPPPQAVRLSEYRPTDFLIDTVDLDICLHRTQTRVVTRLALRRNPKGRADAPLTLDGDGLTLRGIALNGRAIDAGDYDATPDRLALHKAPDAPFTLEIETEIDPSANTQLTASIAPARPIARNARPKGSGASLIFSTGPTCSASIRRASRRKRAKRRCCCRTAIRSSAATSPDGAPLRDLARSVPKALLSVRAGRRRPRRASADSFTTRSGRNVALAIYVEHGKEDRADYAMDALKRAMRWDEDAFGREYDLDVFNIVAVSDFNMGAMENKGLNIFNDKYVLASPQTATDARLRRHRERRSRTNISTIGPATASPAATGFSLCLKEGLTVFRDQEFSADQRSRAGGAHRRRAQPAARAISRGCRPAGASGAAGGLSRDQQFLHGDGL